MVESFLGFALVAFFCILGWAFGAEPESLIWGGTGLAALGFALGIPTAIVYHWRLYRSLVRCERLPRRWWLQPTALHDLIPRDERAGVLVWGALGGTGFLVIVLGIVLTTIGLWRIVSA